MNRAPVVIAISTDGAAPMLGQSIRARIESVVPLGLSGWASAAKGWRSRLKQRLADFAELEYVSSMGLRSILAAAKTAQDRGGNLTICGLRGLPKQVFEMTRLLPLGPVVRQRLRTAGQSRFDDAVRIGRDGLAVEREAPWIAKPIGPDLGQSSGHADEGIRRRNAVRGRARLHVDVGGYRLRRREALAEFTRKVADEVETSGEARALEPMSAADRKVVHDTVAEFAGLATASEGEEPDRRVVIRPDGSPG